MKKKTRSRGCVAYTAFFHFWKNRCVSDGWSAAGRELQWQPGWLQELERARCSPRSAEILSVLWPWYAVGGRRTPGDDRERKRRRLIWPLVSSRSDSVSQYAPVSGNGSESSSLSVSCAWRETRGELETDEEGDRDGVMDDKEVPNGRLRGHVVRGYVYGVGLFDRDEGELWLRRWRRMFEFTLNLRPQPGNGQANADRKASCHLG